MNEQVLLKNRKPGGPATFDDYRRSGGYEALIDAVRHKTSQEVVQIVKDAGLRGRGGAGFPAGVKWSSVPMDISGPKYILPNTDEMEPGTFKDRVLVNSDPHLVIEGIILCAYAVMADHGLFFIRPSYELDAQLIEREVIVAREAGFLGKNILGSDFSFDLEVHRSGGRYICGEGTAQIRAVEGFRPNPSRGGPFPTVHGAWGRPTVVNNVETLSNIPSILRLGPENHKKLAATPRAEGTKLYCVSGKVVNPGCFELPMGAKLGDIIMEQAGGMLPGTEFKACQTGGTSTSIIPQRFFDVHMDYDSMKDAGERLGTGAIIVYDQNTCLVAATLNMINFFVRESCGWCTPCREGLPFIQNLLLRIETGEGREEHITMLREMANSLWHAYCAFAPGAATPVLSLLKYFEDEVREHISQKKCPYGSTLFMPKPGSWDSGACGKFE